MNVRRILIACDGSPDAEIALDWAVTHGAQNRLPLTLAYIDDGVTVLPDEPLSVDDSGTASTALEKRAGPIRDNSPGLEVTAVVLQGDVVSRLLMESDPGTLIVVGAGGHGVLHAPLRWSLGARLIAHAAGPVAVIPGPHRTAQTGVVVGVDGGGESDSLAQCAALVARNASQPLQVIHSWLPPSMWLNPWPLDTETLAVIEEPHTNS